MSSDKEKIAALAAYCRAAMKAVQFLGAGLEVIRRRTPDAGAKAVCELALKDAVEIVGPPLTNLERVMGVTVTPTEVV